MTIFWNRLTVEKELISKLVYFFSRLEIAHAKLIRGLVTRFLNQKFKPTIGREKINFMELFDFQIIIFE